RYGFAAASDSARDPSEQGGASEGTSAPALRRTVGCAEAGEDFVKHARIVSWCEPGACIRRPLGPLTPMVRAATNSIPRLRDLSTRRDRGPHHAQATYGRTRVVRRGR